MAGGKVDNLYIQVSTSAKSASNSLDKLASALEKLGKLTTNSGLDKLASQLDKVTSSAGGATSALSKIKGINASIKSSTSNTNRLTGAFGSLWKMLKKVAVSSASITLFQKGFGLATDVFETANYFRTVMGDFTEEAYAYTEKVSEALGIDESEWMKNQATFMSLAYTFGNTADSAYLMSKNLNQLVYDMSSLKNVDPTVAMQKLRSAFAGEIEPLRDWGVDLSKANLQLVALEHNITKPFDKMTQGEKSQLRYITIMNQLEYAMGNLSKELNSPANQMRLFETAVMKLARAFGNILIPIMNKVLPVLIKITYALRDAVQAIANFLGFELPDMSSWDKFGGSVEDVADDYDKATKAAKKFKGQLAGFDEINNLTTNSPSGSGSDATGSFGNLELPTYESLGKSFLGDALDKQVENILTELPAKLHNFITGVTEKIKTIDWASIGQAFGDGLANLGWPQLMMDLGGFIITGLNAMVQWLVGASGGLVSTGAAIVEGILSGIAQFATNFHDNVAKPLIEAIENIDWKTFGESFGDKLKEIDWVQLITDLGDLIVAGLKALGDWLLGASGGLLDTGIDIATGILLGISNIFTNIVQWIGENVVTPFINGVKSLFGIHSPSTEMESIGENLGDGLLEGLTGLWEKVKEPFVNLWENIKKGAGDAWAAVKEKFKPVTTWFSDKFGKAWDAVKKIFSGEISFKDIKDAVGAAFRDMVNKLIRGLNTVIAKPFEALNKTLNKIREISILGLQPFIKLWGENPIKIPQIPEIKAETKLATGGIITRPTQALLGEEGPEAVVPLKNNTEWINKVAASINGNNDNSQIEMLLEQLIDVVQSKDLTIDGNSITNTIVKNINKKSRLLGEGLV